jgi:gas vesicle protein
VSDEQITPGTGGGSIGGFVTGLAIGTLAGAVLAMILAPQSGEDTRDLLVAKAREAGERARDTAGDAGDLLARGRQIVADAKARIDGAIVEGKDAAAQQRTTLENDSTES